MKAYELLYFVAPSIDEESRLAVMKRIETALAEGNGVVDNVDNWGKRKIQEFISLHQFTSSGLTASGLKATPKQEISLVRLPNKERKN